MTPVPVRSNDIVCLKAIIPQRPYRQQMYIQQRHKRTAEASARWLIDQSHKGVRKRPWSYSVMTNTLCCWLCRILSDLSVHFLTHCPSHAPLTSSPSYCLSFFPPPQTRVWIKSLLVTWAIWGETLSSNLSLLFLSLLIRITSHMWHSEAHWLTYWSHTQESVCGSSK